ncbi:hypothetical protein SDC9_198975 [bioreactor metagenome]|uniref:Uncharacterized protein n=1 Tax=bioreactor metagenome TaxID=1076179 RepID=A0A645IKE5_9ZZZZ
MAQLVDGLHLRRHARPRTGEMPARMGKTAVSVILQRHNALDEQLERVEIARIGHAQLAVVLGKGLDHGVELFLFLGLVFPVGIHGQAEGVFPLVPVVHLDALVIHVGKNRVLVLVAGLPAEVAGQRAIALLHAKLFLGGFHVHGGLLSYSRSGSACHRLRPRCPRG